MFIEVYIDIYQSAISSCITYEMLFFIKNISDGVLYR